MRKIHNPFADLDEYNCFGCAPKNPDGLHMEFFQDGDEVVSTWTPGVNHQGYHNVLHGGIQATMLDEIASWAIYTALDTGGFTAELHVTYRKATATNGGPVEIRARVVRHEKRTAEVYCTLSQDGELRSEATAIYTILPRHIAERRMNLPPREAFLPDE